MNSLYTLGVRQTNSIQADLERLRNGDTSTALLGMHYYPLCVLVDPLPVGNHIDDGATRL